MLGCCFSELLDIIGNKSLTSGGRRVSKGSGEIDWIGEEQEKSQDKPS